MAEIGIAASIISVAAFGISVATTLYETADIMKNSNQQIIALAKHVTQFTSVLNHMGQVLKTEKINCSKVVLRDIQKIKHSCKRTFREIKATVKAERFRRIMWLFKRTKAMELEARLDSQQSMLQCMIHTLTVSKLSRMDSRSKEDSGHITSLKVDLTLLKTFIKESYDNLSALQRAEHLSAKQSSARYQPPSGDGSHLTIDHRYVDGRTFPSDPISGPSAPEPLITRSPSPTSNVPKSEDEESNTDDGGDEDNHDEVGSTKSKDQNDHEGTGPNRDTSSATGLTSAYAASNPYRESNLLQQMVPYSPGGSGPVWSDRLIAGGHGPDSGTTSAAQEVTKSVRLLLDKWTTSGSAPISNILDEEAARENHEAELANKHRMPGPQVDRHRRSSSPLYFDPTHDPGAHEYSHHSQGVRMPPPPWNDPQLSYRNVEKDFSRPFRNLSQPPSRQLGGEILTELRSARGGIYYVKSNNFKQVHYVDQYPIYTCTFVPSHMIPYNEDKILNTELGRGLIRREALDLLAYSYTKSETGNFSISGNLGLVSERYTFNVLVPAADLAEKGEIEELVRLSYQALERNLEERSRKVINERGWGEAISAMNRGMPEMRSNKPWAAPQYEDLPRERPPRPEDWNQDNPPHDRHYRHRPYTDDGDYISIDESGPAHVPRPRLYTREPLPARRRAKRIRIPAPVGVERQEQDATRRTQSEVRFTLPRMQPISGTADIAKEAQTSSATNNVPMSKMDDELNSVRQRLERAKGRKEEAEKGKDIDTAFDLTTYAIPELEAKLEMVLKQQRKEQEKSATLVFQNEEHRRSLFTEVKTESEYDDDEDGSEAERE